ncbi:MAG: hypothetical protein C5B51_03705 [Terriglobia bacterium]|nr:MAG: hypothetical protein C5B51_03705 [Terriglobia bacterium]
MKLSAIGVALFLVAGPAAVWADDLDDALQALKDAQPSKDVAKIKDLAAKAHTVAKKWQEPPPADGDKESYEARARYAKDVDTYSEYSLYALAVQSDAKTAGDLVAALEAQNPKSKYLDMPDVLLIQADAALTRKQTDRALALANRMVAAANKKGPDDIPAADWDRTKSSALARGYFILGSVACERNQYKAADTNLRAALPLIKGNNAMMGPALFCLGVVNYNLANMTANKAKMLEAAKFSEQAAAIPGPTQDQAYKNSMAMKAAAEKMR